MREAGFSFVVMFSAESGANVCANTCPQGGGVVSLVCGVTMRVIGNACIVSDVMVLAGRCVRAVSREHRFGSESVEVFCKGTCGGTARSLLRPRGPQSDGPRAQAAARADISLCRVGRRWSSSVIFASSLFLATRPRLDRRSLLGMTSWCTFWRRQGSLDGLEGGQHGLACRLSDRGPGQNGDGQETSGGEVGSAFVAPTWTVTLQHWPLDSLDSPSI